MSIRSHLSRDVVRIERLSTTLSPTGGQIRIFNTANRGSLPTSLPCRIQPIGTRERIHLGIRGTAISWKMLFYSDPQVTVRDRIVFSDLNGVAHTLRILEPSRDLDLQGRLYRVIGEEVTNEQ